jgi:hypothetical protein
MPRAAPLTFRPAEIAREDLAARATFVAAHIGPLPARMSSTTRLQGPVSLTEAIGA